MRPNVRLQADYDLTKQSTVGVVLQSNYNFFDNLSRTQYTNLNRFGEIYRLSTRKNESEGNGYSNGLTLSYLLKGKDPSERLQIIAAGNLGKNDNGRDFEQQFLRPDFSFTGIDSLQQQGIDYKSNSLSFRINYDKPTKWKVLNISTGISASRTNNHNVLTTRFYKSLQQQYIDNDLLSTNFRFHQNIFTARLAFIFRLPKEWRITTGAQAEKTENIFRFIRGNSSDVTSDYINVLPNVTVRKDFSKTFNTALIYRATIRRPGIGELNPSVDYSDPNNIRYGNPYLLPSMAQMFDWNVGYTK